MWKLFPSPTAGSYLLLYLNRQCRQLSASISHWIDLDQTHHPNINRFTWNGPWSWGAAVTLCVYNTFLHAENLKFYWFLNSFVAFRLFRKGIKNHWFWHPFWHHFGCFFIIFRYFFDIDFCMHFWMPFFRFLLENGRRRRTQTYVRCSVFRALGVPKTLQNCIVDF